MKLKVQEMTIRVGDQVVQSKGPCFIEIPMPIAKISYGRSFSIECKGFFEELPPAPGDAINEDFIVNVIQSIISVEGKCPKVLYVGRREYAGIQKIIREQEKNGRCLKQMCHTQKLCFEHGDDSIDITQVDKDSYFNLSFY